MTLDDCIKRVEKYLSSNDTQPLFVNVQNINDFIKFKQHFNLGNNKFKQAKDYCKKDENPQMDSLLNDLKHLHGNIFLTGFTTHFKLLGEDELKNYLSNLIHFSTTSCHILVLCYQCKDYLIDFIKSDIRLKRIICTVDGNKTLKPNLIFFTSKIFSVGNNIIIDGIENIADAIETSNNNVLYIKTKKRKASYPNALYNISEPEAFEILCQKDSQTNLLDINYGTQEQWEYALNEISKYSSWASYFTHEFGNCNNLHLIASNWNNFDDNKKWLYFIALKLFKSKNNWCLNIAAKNADCVDSLIRYAFRSILNLDWKDKTFLYKYNERKKLLISFGNPDSEVKDYCSIVKSKQQDAIYYLTDNTYTEKKLIFEFLNTYSEKFTYKDISEILKNIYPDLYAYLQKFDFGNELLTNYFQDYKYQKVINKIFSKFEELVEKQARERKYNLILPSRSEKIEAIEKEDTYLYFIDAMGVEFLSFILRKCEQKNLFVNITICRCELPSITSFNKEFIEVFEKGGSILIPNKNGIKDLDNIKHNNQNDYNYQYSNLPIHLIRELEIIDKILSEIKDNLIKGNCLRAVIISDHGASRLAVISQKENKWEMVSKGKHSGRCCPKSEIDEQPTCATEENGFWVLANYDRFKGGRKADIEVHGGATLEEVVIPIIEITSVAQDVEIEILTPCIKFSTMKKNAVIKFFSKTKLNNASVAIGNKFYKAEIKDNQIYVVKIVDLKKAGDYEVDVYSNGNKIKSGLKFTAKKEGFEENELF